MDEPTSQPRNGASQHKSQNISPLSSHSSRFSNLAEERSRESHQEVRISRNGGMQPSVIPSKTAPPEYVRERLQ